MSPPSRENIHDTHGQLPTLASVAAPVHRKESWYHGDELSDEHTAGPSTTLPQVEKEVDDPNAPPSSRAGLNRHESTTLTTLSRLFAVQASTSPDASRANSYNNAAKQLSAYTRNLHFGGGDPAGLPSHLYSRGLLEGRHSDITVHAFGRSYNLHRIILDRAPFFRSALSEPWLESSARETTVHPEDIDPSISQASFELALKRLYGCSSMVEESRDAVGLFATGCWLEMQDLIESSIDTMLRQMSPATLAPLIKLVTSNYYGRAGDKILASAKAMLCRDGWQMPLRFWEGIPGDIVREIVGGDGFFIDGEWDRWVLSRRILNRRLKARAVEAGLVEPGNSRKPLRAPETSHLMAVRFDTVYRRNNPSTARGIPDSLHRWVSLYTHPDIEPLLVLLDEGIHYVHLEFEQLQRVREASDILGVPVLPQKVIADALWAQMELRQRVVNARENEMELGISVTSTEDYDSTTRNEDTAAAGAEQAAGSSGKGKHRATTSDDLSSQKTSGEDESFASDSWDSNGRPRKFWIPTSDCNIVMGYNADPVIATSNNTTLQRQGHANRLSATFGAEDVQWASDFSAVTAQPRTSIGSNPGNAGGDTVLGAAEGSSPTGPASGEVRYSHFPPFRFAASFPNPRLLKERKRVYSRTIFYAGSLWNIYIQKVASSRSKQLGVYLHRAKERDAEDVGVGSGVGVGSVDERIGLLEREMLLRGERSRRRRRTLVGLPVDETEGTASDGSLGEIDHSLINNSVDAGGRSGLMRDLLNRSRNSITQAANPRPSDHRHSYTQSGPQATAATTSASDAATIFTPSSDDSDTDSPSTPPPHRSQSHKHSTRPTPTHMTLPPYTDARPTIKTYFKIYSPSRGGRMLSVYESAPDQFNFSQSWGWKSSTLMVDEGIESGEDILGGTVSLGEEAEGSGSGGGDAAAGAGAAGAQKREDARLRFMVVIGNI